jgi:riboflavin biosynthesis pyrimidine reductase
VLTASGALDLSHPALRDPDVEILIITTEEGAAALASRHLPAHVEVREVGAHRVEPEAALALLAQRGARVVLCEGGSHLLGQLARARLVDELFLTIAPQLAGRSETTPRLALLEGTAFGVADAPWGRLASLRRAGDHLFARYQF